MQLVSKGTSKKRLKKDITLPRLQLLAVTAWGVRAANFIASELMIISLKWVLWFDSTCVLHWLRTCKPLPLFVVTNISFFVMCHLKKTLQIFLHRLSLHHKVQGIHTVLKQSHFQQILIFSMLNEVLTCLKSPSIYYITCLIKTHPMIYLLSAVLERRPFKGDGSCKAQRVKNPYKHF